MRTREQRAVARVVTETVLTATLGWLAWCGLWLLLAPEESGTGSPLSTWERYRPYLGVMAAGLVPLLLWAVPTLAIGLLVRHRPGGLRTLVAGGVAVLCCAVPATWLVATSREQGGSAGWGLVLIGTVAAPVMALVVHGVVASVLDAVRPHQIDALGLSSIRCQADGE